MTRMPRSVAMLLVLFAFCLCLPLSGQAQTINAATCSSTDVQTALSKVAADGTTVNIPAGTCTWSTPVTYTQIYTTNIIGAGNQTVTGGGDATIIVDAVSHSPTDNGTFVLNVAAGKVLRLSGVTFQGGSSLTYLGIVRFGGSSSGQLRVDHAHWRNLNQGGFSYFNNIPGVFDHDIFDGGGTISWRAYGHGWGHADWAGSTALGSSQLTYFENDIFNNGSQDCYNGGEWVVRFSTFNLGATMQNALTTHPTGGAGSNIRGCPMWEAYQNTFSTPAGSSPYNVYFISSGVGVFWGNSVTNPTAFSHWLTLHNMRRNANTYPESSTPGGWGYCGTSFNGTGSAWDQNSNSTTGYACLDQVGRGQGDLITGNMPTAVNSITGIISWPRQAHQPIYEWMDTGWSGQANYYATAFDGGITQNQDYYLWCNSASASGCTSFNGTVGVGSGLLSARPSTCIPNPIIDTFGSSFGVAYWATDQGNWNNSNQGGQGQLYVCSATNTWRLYYTPYTYPHPLTQGSGTPPAPPTNLGAVVN